MERRNITLEKKHLDILSPLLEKHNGNISASIREIIDFADIIIKSYGSLENATIDAVSSEKMENQRVLVDQMLWQWLLENCQGVLPGKDIVRGLFDHGFDGELECFAEEVSDLCLRLGWKTSTRFKEPMTFILSGGSENQRLLLAKIICLHMQDHNYGIEKLTNTYSVTRLDLTMRNSETEAFNDIMEHMGTLERGLTEIRSRPDFWNTLINTHINTGYHMVTIHRKDYERLLSGSTDGGTDIFSVYTGLPCKDINLQRVLPIIKTIFETSRIVDKIEMDGDMLKIFHSYVNQDVIESITRTIIEILEKNGYHYETVQVSRIIVLHHRTEIDGRISELVNNLLSAKGGFNHELVMFLIFLDGLKDKTEINSTVEKLGEKMGEQIIKEYGKELKIKKWDMEKFKEAFSDIDVKLGRESVLELIDPNVMHYIVNRCQIVHPGGKFNKHLCNITHGLLKGAVDYVFKGDAIIKPKRMIGSGDLLCEFYVVLQTKVRMPDTRSYDL